MAAVLPSVIDLSDAPQDVITVLLGSMELEQRFTCALVCSDWAKAAAATTHSIVKHRVRDLTGLQQWLEKNGSQIETMQLHADCLSDMDRLPCSQLRDLLLHGQCWTCKLMLEGKVWSDIAAATKLTSLSLQWVCTDSHQADVVSALTALPDLQQLSWQEVECGQQRELSDSRLLQQLTKLTSLDLRVVSAEALQHLGSVSKLQHLSISQAAEWAAANCPGLQQLTGLTSLQLYHRLQASPSTVSHLTALQQLEVSEASTTELNGLKALTALTKLGVFHLIHDKTHLKLPNLHILEIGAGYDTALHMSQLSSCTPLRKLTLHEFCLVGPDSLVASSMLQELWVQDCSLSSPEGPACVDPWQLVFPGPCRLPHLTLLSLRSVSPPPRQADLERLVACCSGLRRLELTAASFPQRFISASAFECLAQLTSLVELELSTVDDQQCSSFAQLTGLQELAVIYPEQLSAVGLRHLARLQQLTRLSFGSAFDSSKVSAVLQAQLSAACESGYRPVLVNKVRAATVHQAALALQIGMKDCYVCQSVMAV